MEKTRIDWCDSTWNPVTGCLHGCEYCYARNQTHRFGGWMDSDGDTYHDTILKDDSPVRVLDEPLQILRGEKNCNYRWQNAPYPYDFIPTFHRYRLNDYMGKKGRNIFVCSMADLFGKWVPNEWIQEVFEACGKAPQHNYIFLTKNPGRYVELQDKNVLPERDNMWYGTSVTDGKSLKVAADAFGNMKISENTFFSIEPILENITNTETWSDCVTSQYMDWVIIGAETGRRKGKVTPDKTWIRSIAFDCDENWNRIPIFMKSSLADIWGGPLIQEFPKELMRKEK